MHPYYKGMLLEHFAYLRTLPLEERRRRAFIYSAVATACIVLLWGSVLYFGNSSYLHQNDMQKSTPIKSPTMPDFSDAASSFLEEKGVGAMPTLEDMSDVLPNNQPLDATTTAGTEQIYLDQSSTTASAADPSFVQSILQEVEP